MRFFGFAHNNTSANQLNALSSQDNTEYNGEKMRAYCDTCKKETVVEPRTGLGLAMLFALIFGPLVFCIPRKTTLHCSKCGTMIPVNADNQPVPRCPKCHVFVEESDAFCPKCGANIKHLKTCTKCKTVNKKHTKYCINCGNELK